MFNSRIGQTSVEYLTTYGWMIAAVTIVGGTMYTQVDYGSGCQLQSTDFSPPFPVIDNLYQYENNTVFMTVQNPQDKDVRIQDVSILSEGERKASFEVNKELNGQSTTSVTTNQFNNTEECQTLQTEITYTTNSLQNLTTKGKITGKLDLVPLAAVMQIQPAFADPKEQITFNASESEGTNTISNYKWDFGDGNTSEKPVAQHNYSKAGVYTVELTVEDSEGLKTTKTTQVYIGGVIRKGGGSLTKLGTSNTIASTCIGDKCSNTTQPEDEVVTTNGDHMTGPLVTQKIILLDSKTCITSQRSLDADQGCKTVSKGESQPLSESSYKLDGSLKVPQIISNNTLCIGPETNC
ncbi:PKD domain containing protein [Candidatus Nanohalobium constans]|uniref:PKD domain containing protein n=1 Tax=Candidatus Nanohalobium constans TaxID=2565781 RepID=A0A5Q0UG32_9ARCH|nr:PKD domain containing protein [Candidatus Nanohalobium constans]